MLATLNKRSDTHNSCEDSFFVKETDELIYGCICDGCSTGIKSHFASQAICYAFEKTASNYINMFPITSERAVRAIIANIFMIKSILTLDNMNFLSTLLMFQYHKPSKKLLIRAFGDGFYSVNDVECIIDQNNIPDYIGYHLNDDYKNLGDYLDKYPERLYIDVEKFLISTDGIERIERGALQKEATIEPLKLLLHPPTGKTYLDRMWNLIKKDGFILSDDLTIVSYVNN